jgi:hypothetical protein
MMACPASGESGLTLGAVETDFLKSYCADCHSDGANEGDLEIDLSHVDWTNRETLQQWEEIQTMVSRGIMPPPDADAPSAHERSMFLGLVERKLMEHLPIGGTQLRRLNRREYAQTVQRIFGLSGYKVPHSFPPDNEANGFDNQASALVVAGSHLEALVETANAIADQIFPPPKKAVLPSAFHVPAEEMVVSYSSACLIDGTMRLASSGDNVVRNATWPTKFEAPASGIYTLTVSASAIHPEIADEIPELTVATMAAADRSELQVVGQISVGNLTANASAVEMELNRGDTVVFRYLNGPFSYEDQKTFQDFLEALFTSDPKLAAAWDHVGKPPRGGSGWQRVSDVLNSKDVDPAKFAGNEKAIADLAKRVASNKVNSGETLVYKYFQEGPAIAIHHVTLEGPIKRIRDRDTIRSENLQNRLLGKTFDRSDPTAVRRFIKEFLSSAFRRPATPIEIDGYQKLVEKQAAETGDIDQGLHLAIRTALISPAFLYRGFSQGKLDNYELASRLSYFLTSAPPSEGLQKIAKAGRLTRSAVLAKESKRLISKSFSRDFSVQWLGTDVVETLMPDMRLTARFSPRHRKTIGEEVVETFHHILNENLPVTRFIDADFVFTDHEVGFDIYGLKSMKMTKKNRPSKSQRNKIRKVSVESAARQGGLLSMPAIMMSTANGVDTQPVLRGVWALENIFGTPPPEPPDAVPALTPDTSNATTVKDRLAAHMSDGSCAQCHREIDPIGFALENYDPIGRWRSHYPRYTELDGNVVSEDGQKVDATGILPDGTQVRDIGDLKRWLADHPEVFARCLSNKLLTYATGRKLNFRETKLIEEIVDQEIEKNDLRFRDLLLALIDSEIFRTK